MIGASLASFGMIAPLALELAVNAWVNSLRAVGGSHVPAGFARTQPIDHPP